MSKIVKAINTMIVKSDKITNTQFGRDGREIFFQYDQKHKWSISEKSKHIYYYTGDQSLDDLASFPGEAWDDFTQMVSYGENELSSNEARASIRELHTIVKEKVLGMDDVLDEIIGDEDE